MKLSWDKADDFLLAGDRKIRCWSKVRNELNGLRPRKGASDVFYTTTIGGNKGVPSMPRTFPVGNWKIVGIIPHPDRERDGYLWPFYIATDAWQKLDVWELDEKGFYKGKTDQAPVSDFAYGLHFSSSDWTQGCIRIALESDLRWLVTNVKAGDEFVVIGEADGKAV